MQEFIAIMESAYGIKLPAMYNDFLLNEKFEDYPKIEFKGHISGEYLLDFTDELLNDAVELGENAGIYDMPDVDWEARYSNYIPLASISHPEIDEPKGFLVMDIKSKDNPVLLFDEEGWRLYPLADSFEAFLKNLPVAKTDIKKAFVPREKAIKE
jgi:hypothetical protein